MPHVPVSAEQPQHMSRTQRIAWVVLNEKACTRGGVDPGCAHRDHRDPH